MSSEYSIFIFFRMLTIRLQRKGRKNLPFYRVVVAESSRPVKGKFLEIVGHYNPLSKEVVMKKDRIEFHVQNGAQLSQTVARLAVKNGMEAMGKFVAKRATVAKKEKATA